MSLSPMDASEAHRLGGSAWNDPGIASLSAVVALLQECGGLEKWFDMFKAKVADAFRKAASRRNISLGRVGETMCEDDATSTSMRDEEGAMYGIQQ
jgi:hypothetical protein